MLLTEHTQDQEHPHIGSEAHFRANPTLETETGHNTCCDAPWTRDTDDVHWSGCKTGK